MVRVLTSFQFVPLGPHKVAGYATLPKVGDVMLPTWSLKVMKSEKLTVPEYFWARFKGKNKASIASSPTSNGQGADEVDRLTRDLWAVMRSGVERAVRQNKDRPVTTDDDERISLKRRGMLDWDSDTYERCY